MLKKIIASLLAIAGVASLAPASLAAGVDLRSDFEPFQKTFVISAYYSPLPNQSVYYRGSYEADVRLNGRGTNGADGTQVFPGMLAAPKSYPFGLKIEIPGLGVGGVHDRGGAIVAANGPDSRGYAHDRLDVWMGHGEEGLARALAWGKRTVTGTVYPKSHSIATGITLPADTASLARLPKSSVRTLAVGDSGDDVAELQKKLAAFGYYRGEIDGKYGDELLAAVIDFQVDRRVVANESDSDAGIVGPRTRAALASNAAPLASQLATSVLQSGAGSTAAEARFPVSLSQGDRGDRVRELQIALAKIGSYECEINGIFDENMASCVARFQIQSGLLGESDPAAGKFGPKTRDLLNQKLTAYETELNAAIAASLPGGEPQIGDSGEAVRKLQQGLAVLGFYAGEPNGNYDDATRAAVAKFQIANGVLKTETDFGAGHFGPRTRAVFEDKLRAALAVQPQLPENPEFNRAAVRIVEVAPEFAANLTLGDSGAEVAKLQQTLAKLEYFSGEASGTFDEATRAAVLKFQLDNGIVNGPADTGAGNFGPKTRAALAATAAREKITLQVEQQA